jgi:urease accessory protein
LTATLPVGAASVGGSYRLRPEHFDPARVPPEVSAYGTAAHTLPVGSPGKVGLLELTYGLRGEGRGRRTELVHHYQKTPFQIMRPLYYDECRPDMPYTFVMTTGGGVLHGDRLRMDLRFEPDTAAHVTTQAHTKVYRMETGYATSLVDIDVGERAYVEYVPDPVIPFDHSRYYQRTKVTLHDTATLVLGETMYAGRLSRDERHEYDAFATDLEIVRPDGTPLVLDRVRLGVARPAVGPAVMDGKDIVSTLFVVAPDIVALGLVDAWHDALAATQPDIRFGISALPRDAGAWLRMLGDDPVAMSAASTTAWQVSRQVLTGLPAPRMRKT